MYKLSSVAKGVIFRTLLEKNPHLLQTVRNAQFAVWKHTNRIRTRNITLDDSSILRVNPRDINRQITEFPAVPVSGGNWDRFTTDISDSSPGDVRVCIDRDGHFLLASGGAVLQEAIISEKREIPVEVVLRHAQWQRFKSELRGWTDSRGGLSYQEFSHPDLQNIRVQHRHGRFNIMLDYLTESRMLNSGTVLDIGAFFGYFCHRFEEAGFECTASEIHPKHLYFMRKLHGAQDRRFKIDDRNILEGDHLLKFDIVLALSIFHHFLKTPQSVELLKKLLRRLDMKVMFFQPHHINDPVMRNAYLNPSPEEFVQFIIEHSCLAKATCLKTVARRRELYVLES